MAISVIQTLADLHGELVLAPERYDPRRRIAAKRGRAAGTVGDFFSPARETISASSAISAPVVVLDTSDAREGVIGGRKRPVAAHALGSSKKLLAPGDVLISRLRPYLRQVAFLDGALFAGKPRPVYAASTEFFVLRFRGEGSGAFLVPLLLSKQVQAALAAAQEGGHHPRFSEETLLQLPVPRKLWDRRAETAALVERAIAGLRESERAMARALKTAEGSF